MNPLTYEILGLLAAVVATGIQIYWRMNAYRYVERDLAAHFTAVRDLMEEVGWLRPLGRLRRRREVMSLLGEQRAELFMYRRAFWDVVAWALLFLASVYALIAAVVEQSA